MVESYTVAFVIIMSSLLFGSVETWAFAVVGIMTLLLFNIWLIRGLRDGTRLVCIERQTAAMIILFVSFVVVQVVPLPPLLLGILAPQKSSFLDILSLDGFSSISVYPYATVKALMKLIIYIILFMVSAFFATTREGHRPLLKIIVVFGFLLSMFAIIQRATWNGKIYWFRELTKGGDAFGPFVNRNHFAGFIGMIIPFGIALSLQVRERAHKFLYIFMTVIMGLALFYSLSRGGILSFIVSMFFFVTFVIIRKYSSSSKMVVGIFLSLLASYLLYFGMGPILNRFAYTDISLGQRAVIWNAMMHAVGDFFPMGSGLGTFPYISHIYHPESVGIFFDHVHNDYLELVTDTGVMGVVLFILFLIVYIKDVMKSRWWEERYFYVVLAGISSIVYMTVHSVVDFNLHIPSNAILLSTVMGLVYGRAQGVSMASKRERRP